MRSFPLTTTPPAANGCGAPCTVLSPVTASLPRVEDEQAGRAGGGGSGSHLARSVVISLDRARSARLLRDTRRTGLFPPVIHPWGSLHAYAELLTSRPRSMAVLDVPNEGSAPDLGHLIGLLRRLAPVTVLAPRGTRSAALFEAGATNVLARDMPLKELAARLVADQRWLARENAHPFPPQEQDLLPPHLLPPQATQKVLLTLVLTSPTPWCCHDLTRLLGTAEQPLSRAALRARMPRLEHHLDRLGLALHRTGGWGRFSYTAAPAARLSHGSRRTA